MHSLNTKPMVATLLTLFTVSLFLGPAFGGDPIGIPLPLGDPIGIPLPLGLKIPWTVAKVLLRLALGVPN